MASVQTTILKCVLLDKGLTDGQAEDIGLLLLEEPENMQQVFYYRCLDYTQKEIASTVGVTQQAVSYILKNENKVRKYLKAFVLC